jgi:leucyl-tRNA synthetase
MYEMFLGPVEQSKPWDMQGIEGVSKFIRRFWGLFYSSEDHFEVSLEEPNKDELKILHRTIKKVTEDIENFSFNTAVSAFMMAVNDLKKIGCNKIGILSDLTKLIAPFAPFVAEDIWCKLRNSSSVHLESFPELDESYLVEDEIQYPLCVNGKKRTLVSFSNEASKDEIEKAALANEEIQKWIEGKQVLKVIVVPNRMVNIVVKG